MESIHLNAHNRELIIDEKDGISVSLFNAIIYEATFSVGDELELMIEDENKSVLINRLLFTYNHDFTFPQEIILNEHIGVFKFIKIGISTSEKVRDLDLAIYFEIKRQHIS